MSVRFLPVALVAALLLPTAAGAVTVSGQVTDEQGVGIFDVDLDFFDRNLGMIIFTPNDNTDFNGFYSVDVPTSQYDISFRPPFGSPFLLQEVRMDITGPTVINMTLPVGQAVTGTVTDLGGAPLFNIDLDFFDPVLGDVIDTSNNGNDNTDSAGVFSVPVPASTYDIRFTPPLGQPYAAKEVPGVIVTGPLVLGTITLEPGLFVSGTVVDPGMSPVSGGDLDFEDVATGATVFTPRDNTDSVGVFNVAVATGVYDIIVSSPSGSGLAWKTLHATNVTADLALGTVQLEAGFAVTGTVQDELAAAVVGGDLDMIDTTTGQELPTPNDNTDGTGAFSLLAPASTVDLIAFPPVGMMAAAAILRDVPITGVTDVGAITLPTGFSVSGTVTSGGAPVIGADIDALDLAAAMQKYPTPNDNSDGTGTYGIRLPGGTFLLIADPPLGSGLSPDTTLIALLNADTIVNFDLPGGVAAPVVQPSAGVSLLPNVPNPFRTATTLAYDLPAGTASARLSIYDTAGRLMRTFDRTVTSGRDTVRWDGRDRAGNRVASGVYYYRLEANGASRTRKMVVLR